MHIPYYGENTDYLVDTQPLEDEPEQAASSENDAEPSETPDNTLH